MTGRTADDLIAAREREDWAVLDQEVRPLVGFALKGIKCPDQDYQDARQEGLLAGLRAVRTWQSELGALSNHVITRARYAIRDYLKRTASVVRGASYADMSLDDDAQATEEDEPGAVLDGLTYPNDGPAEYVDIGAALQRDTATDSAGRLLTKIGTEGDNLRQLYGIGAPRKPMREIAAERGVPLLTVWRETDRAKRNMEQVQKSPDYAHTHPRNRVRLTHLPADRFPGFWNGLAGVVGMGGAWRESTGRVFADRAWKPTADDIAKGARR